MADERDPSDPIQIRKALVLNRLETHHKSNTEGYKHSLDAAAEAKFVSTVSHLGEIPEGGIIADLGSGTGKVAELTAMAYSGERVTVIGVDKSHEMLELAASQRSLVKLKYGDILDKHLFPNNYLDGIISSTTGHEVESFEGKGKMNQVIDNTFSWLKPGGKLSFRDFAKPERTEDVYMEILEQGGVDDVAAATIDGVLDYKKLSKRTLFAVFHDEFAQQGRPFEYQVVHVDGREMIKVAPEWAHEFYLRKDYTDNWRQEIQEKYTYWTPKEAEEVLIQAGYEGVEIVPDQNRYILDNRLQGKIALFELDTENRLQPIEIPMTHMVMTGRKPAAELIHTGADRARQEAVVDYEERASTIQFDREKWQLHIGDELYNVIKGVEPIFGSKKVVYHLEGEPRRVIKTVQTDAAPGRPEFNLHAKFKAIYQAVEREDVLDSNHVPHLRITGIDPEGPPYRYFIQEDVPEGSVSAAELIRTGSLSEDDIAQMASYINTFERDEQYQLDTNPYNWYRTTDAEGKNQMVYVDGKVYLFEEDWMFKRIGLSQWLDESFLSRNGVQTARIPTEAEFLALKKQWQTSDNPRIRMWKQYLHPSLQP